MKYATLAIACLAATLSACAGNAPTQVVAPEPVYKTKPQAEIKPSPADELLSLLEEYESGRVDPSMIPDTPEEIADQNTALALMDEAETIRNKPMAELTISDTSRLRSIDREMQQMRMKYITSKRSSDHLSEFGLEAARKRRLE